MDENTPYCFYTHIAQSPATSDFDGTFVSVLSHSIVIKEIDEVKVTPWLYTSDSAYLTLQSGEEKKDETNTYVCGALAEKEKQKVAWISSEDSLAATGFYLSEGSNFDLFLSSLHWMSPNNHNSIDIESNPIITYTIALSDGSIALISLIVTIIFPCIFFALGISIRYWRRRT